ncbi:DNA ligase 4-like isoform X1 [Punica granatum]|uniref:DNA ligase n=1 Tax=Punica granatum TaxID=22663 RepID=A0A6P8CCF8_PUNGR|nr:DNA ligase 4-like isoform X1 [Punica granatum]
MSGDTKFSVLVSLFNWMQKSKSSAVKRSKFRKFLDTFCKPCDYFSAIRIILPSLDRERGTYGLKESVLATCLVDALGMSRDSEDAVRLFNWRRGGPKTGANAGNFAMVATEVLQRRQGTASGGLTINELNDLLDRLASAENRAEKTSVLSTLIKKTNAQEMKWIVMIILKDLKLGVSEKSIFHEFHPDAEDLFNVTCDLKLVCERLRDRSQRHKRQDIEVGKPVRPQLAVRVGNAATAWKKLHGKEVVVECKFDGDRIQIHKNGTEVHFFSRNFLDHSEYEHGMLDIIVQNILVDRCILDGEMLVWDKSLNHFAEFGSNQEIAKAAREGLDSDRQLCYVAFDILYSGDTSVIHQSLKERHELLRKDLKPIKGRLEILVPDGGLNTLRRPGEPCWSLIVHTLDDVERFFKETIENRDEGIVLKDLSSKWEPGDRSGKWLKLKPEYIRASSDLDVLIIGGYYGSGRRGGEVAQFLVGLAERPAPNSYPRRFISFCRVGTGLTDDELDAVVTKLKPHFRKYEYPKKGPPSFYQVTNHSKERPDVWVESPEKSIILAITSDIRTISSEVFAAPYSLRFPRIDRVRWDKPWHECLDVQSFMELVQSSNGTTQRDTGYKDQSSSGLKRKRSSEKGKKEKNKSLVPSHFTHTDVSHVKGESRIFSNMMFYFINVPSNLSLDALHKMVVENGGTFSMNLNNSVTHCIAAESKGIKFQAATRSKDVIHYSWVLDCCSQKRLLPLQPKYFLFLSDTSKRRLQEEIDEFSDCYYWDLDLEDIKQLLSNVKGSEDSRRIEYYKEKYCPKEKWSRFRGCSIHFLPSASALQPEQEILLKLVERRLGLEVHWGSGKVSKSLAGATHLVVLEVPGLAADLHTLTESLSAKEKRLLRKSNLHVVSSKWLEDCLESDRKLPEDPYNLHLVVTDESVDEEGQEDDVEDRSSDLASGEKPTVPPSLEQEDLSKRHEENAGDKGATTSGRETDVRRKSGRPPSASTKRERLSVTQARRTRPRLTKKGPKINEIVSDDENNSDTMDRDMTASRDTRDDGMITEIAAKTSEGKAVEDLESSHRRRSIIEGILEDIPATREEKPNEGCRRTEPEKEREEKGEENIDPKLEIMTDPVQAMLLDMIPSLGMMKKESTSQPSPSEEKAEREPGPRSAEGPTEELVVPKKKKVSYKDLAGELLKDW